MANEFKIKKGLIVTGASGGTVVDIQGSQGQLFSVTDDLSGSIFAVSDISGVPIFDVNSSGISYFDGNVGIGTTGPVDKLQIGDYTGSNSLSITSADGANYAELKLREFNNNYGVTFKLDSNLDILNILYHNNSSSGQSAMAISRTSGNVGIGVTSPNEKLQVGGNINAYINGGIDAGLFASTSAGSTTIALRSNGVTHFNGGNVGIGTTAPNAKLNVFGTGGGASVTVQEDLLHIGGNELGGVGGYAGIRLAGTASSSYGVYIRGVKTLAHGNYWNDALTFSVTRTNTYTTIDEAMRITSDGNVGIGTTAPTGKLTIDSNSALVLDNKADLTKPFIGFGAHWNGSDIVAQGASYYGMAIEAVRGYPISSSSINFTIGGSGGSFSNLMTIRGDGNVGIGTTNPLTKLHIDSSTFPQVRINNETNAGESGIRFRSFDGTNDLHGDIFVDASAGTEVGRMGFRVPWNGTERLTILSTGNVGIGTTSPAVKLHVSGEIKGTSFSGPGEGLDNLLPVGFYAGTPASTGVLIKTNIDTNYGFMFGELKLEQFNFASTQTVSFSATLTNTGTVHTKAAVADIAITIKLFVYGGEWWIWVPTATTYITVSAFIYTGAGYQGQYKGFNEVYSVIGASVPSTGVTGLVDIVADVYVTTGSAGGPGPYLPLTAGSTKPLTGSLYMSGASTYVVGGDSEMLVGQDVGGYYLFTGFSPMVSKPVYIGDNASFISINTAGSTRMRITSTGNVGIGTTNPGEKLTIVGSSATTFQGEGIYNSYAYGNAADKTESRLNLGKLESSTYQPMGAVGAFPANNTSSANGILSFYTRTSQSVTEKMRITADGGISFGSTGTAYGTPGQVLTSAGNASPTWETPTTGDITAIVAGDGMTGTSLSGPIPTLNVVGGTGITANADDVAITYVGAGNAILAAVDGSGTTLSTGAKIWFSDDGTIAHANVSDLPFTNTAGTVTSVGGTGTVSGISLSGTVTSTGNLTLGGTLSASITNISDATRWWNNFGDPHGTRTSFDASTPSYGFGWRYVQGTTNGPATGGSQYYSAYVGLGNDYSATGAGSYGMYLAIDRNTANPYLSIRYNENNSLSTWRRISAGKADTLTTARNIAGVSFDGSANISLNNNAITNGAGYTTNTGTVTGTGTTNYVSKFTSASGIENSAIYDNAGNVGIGTTGPNGRLQINQGTDLNVAINTTTNDSVTVSRISSLNNAATASMPLVINGSRLVLTTNTTERMRINSSGNVGIGTTGPTEKLHVDGSALVTYNNSFQSTNSVGNKAILARVSPTSGIVNYAEYATATNLNGFVIGSDDARVKGNITGDSLEFITNTSTRMTVLSSGNVGIGTTNPVTPLQVTSATNAVDVLRIGNTAGDSDSVAGITHLAINHFNAGTNPSTRITAYQDGVSGWPGGMYFSTRSLNTDSAPVERMRIASSGNVVIGTTTTGTAYALYVSSLVGQTGAIETSGSVKITTGALGVNFAPSATAGRIDASNDIVAYQTSDKRLKENITPITNALEKVKSLTGVEFDWKEETKHVHGYEGHDTGIIAQQVLEVMPTAVRTNDTGYLSVRYEKLIGLLIEGMKEQQAQIDELKAQINDSSR